MFKLFKWLHRWGCKNYQIILVPIKEKKIHSIYINHYFIVFFFALLTVAICFTLPYYFQQRPSKKIEIQQLSVINSTYKEKVDSYKKFIRSNEEQFSKYTKEINNIMEVLGQKNSKKLWQPSNILLSLEKDNATSKSIFYVFKENELPKTYRTPKEIERLNQLRVKSIITLEHLKDIKGFLQLKETVINYIPTQWPIVDGKGYKTSGFGIRLSPFSKEGAVKTFHTGVDIAAAPNIPILAASDGTVVFSGIKEGYGNTIILQHKFGYQTLYGHNSRNIVRVNQQVRKGQRIALIGKSGRSTGFHLHFEIRISNVPVDPWPYLIIEN